MHDEHTFFDMFEYEGEWWLPGLESQRRWGTLSYNNAGIELRINGELPAESVPKYIYGIASPGRFATDITVIPRWGGLTRRSGEITILRYFADYVLVGTHLPVDQEFRTDKLAVTFTNLSSWLGHHPFQEDFELHEGEPRTTITSIPPDPAKVVISENPRLQVSVSHEEVISHSVKSVNWRFTTFLRIDHEPPLHLSEWVSFLLDLGGFLSLLIGKAVQPERVLVSSVAEDRVAIYWPIIREGIEQDVPTFRMLAPYPLIKHAWPTLLSNWYHSRNLLRPVFELLMTTFFDPKMFRELKFINLVQALESLHHRIAAEDEFHNAEDFEHIVATLISAIPPRLPSGASTRSDFISSAKSYLRGLNRFSQQRRLKELLRTVDPRIRDRIAGDDYKSFARKVNATRNFLVHRPEETDEPVFTEAELGKVSRDLQLLVCILLLQHFGLDNSTLSEAVARVWDTFGYVTL